MGSPTLRFRALMQADRGRLAEMLSEAYAPLLMERAWAGEADRFTRFDAGIFANRNHVNASLVFLGMMGQDIVGFIACQPDEQRRSATLDEVCVLPAHRHRGFGKQMLREALRRLKNLGVATVLARVPEHTFFVPAHRMLTSCGFKETDRVRGTTDPRERLIDFTLHREPSAGHVSAYDHVRSDPTPSHPSAATPAAGPAIAVAAHSGGGGGGGGPIELASDPDATTGRGIHAPPVRRERHLRIEDTSGEQAMQDQWDNSSGQGGPGYVRGIGATALIILGAALAIWTAITAYHVLEGTTPPMMVQAMTPSTDGQALITVPEGPINFSPAFFTFAGYVLTCGLITMMVVLSATLIKSGVALVRRS